jgi:hypothetical protein
VSRLYHNCLRRGLTGSGVVYGQSCPKFLQALQGLGGAADHIDVRVVLGLEETLIDGHLQKAQQMIEIAGGVDHDARLVVDPKLGPGKDLEKFVQRTEATRQRDKSVRFLRHKSFALMHGVHHGELGQTLVRYLYVGK